MIHLHDSCMPNCIFHLQNLMVLMLDDDDSARVDYKGIERIPNLVELIFSHNNRCIEFT